MRETKKFVINGVTYDKLEDLPEEIRNQIDQDKNGKIDVLEEIEKNPNPINSLKLLRKLAKTIRKNTNTQSINKQLFNPSSGQGPVTSNAEGNVIKMLVMLMLIGIIVAIIIYLRLYKI